MTANGSKEYLPATVLLAPLPTLLLSLQTPPESPCLARLAAEVAAGRREALEPF